MLRKLLALAWCAGAACASAQFSANADPDWKEVEAPPPPVLRTQGLIPLDIPRAGTQPLSGLCRA